MPPSSKLAQNQGQYLESYVGKTIFILEISFAFHSSGIFIDISPESAIYATTNERHL